MKKNNLAAYFSIAIGIIMIVYRVFAISMNMVPEIQPEPIAILCRVAAEMLTPAMLTAGGLGIFRNAKWGVSVNLVSLGMLIYTSIQSPGYFLQQVTLPIVVMFAVILALVTYFAAVMIMNRCQDMSAAS